MASTQNLASGVLYADINSSATSLSVSCGSGSSSTLTSVWPSTPFYITVMPSMPVAGVANSLDSEVMKVSAISASNNVITMTVVRGQRGTTAKAFSTGAIVTNGIYMDDILDRIYPVGSIYMSATFSTATQVQNALGGTWVAWGAGRVPVGMGSNGTTTYSTVEATGGSDTHKHQYGMKWGEYYGYFSVDPKLMNGSSTSWKSFEAVTNEQWNQTTLTTGGSTKNNSTRRIIADTTSTDTRQPYITCYMYKRTA